MRLRFRDGGDRVEALFGMRTISVAQAEIEALRLRCGQGSDVSTSLHRIRRWSAIHRQLPVALLVWREGELSGLVWLSYRRKFGVVLGLVKSGNLCGQGSVIARPGERRGMLETAARVLMRYPLAHTVLLSGLCDGLTEAGPDRAVPGIQGGWHFREVRFRLELRGGLEATMDRFGRKMRRNLRYYRRRAEDMLGCRFVPELTAGQRREAVAALNGRSAYRLGAWRAAETDAALLETPGQFAMGMLDGQGNWLSYLVGWREPDGTHVDWQLNHDGHKAASLGTVMRSYLVEHEAQRGSPAIVFVGLTSDFWSRVCEPAVCGDLLASRTGVVGEAARWLTTRLRPQGQVAALHARAAAQFPQVR